MHPASEVNYNDIHTLTFPNAVRLCAQLDNNAVTRQWHALVMADDQGDIADKVMLELFSIDHAAGWAMGFHHAEGSMAQTALLISSATHDLSEPAALDQWEFECLRSTLSSTDIELRDWLLTDGVETRSLAYTRSPESAWLTDPLDERTQQLEQPDPGLA